MGRFTKKRLGHLVVIDETSTANAYKKLLEEHLLDFMQTLDDNITYIFQDDNAPVHSNRARTVIEWKEKIYQILFFGLHKAQTSIQLSIYGIYWVEKYSHPKNLTELSDVLQSEWLKVSRKIGK